MTVIEAFRRAMKYSGDDLRRGALWGILPAAFYWFAQGPGYGIAVGATITAMVYIVRVGKNANADRSVARSRARREDLRVPD
jgi:uncharacterized membrane protein